MGTPAAALDSSGRCTRIAVHERRDGARPCAAVDGLAGRHAAASTMAGAGVDRHVRGLRRTRADESQSWIELPADRGSDPQVGGPDRLAAPAEHDWSAPVELGPAA